jgi:glycosyltransferase involved in cell wall biosynthesis
MPESKIKTLKFLTHFGVGGTERQFVYISRGLDRSRFDLQIACMARMGAFLPDIEALGLPITEYKTDSLYSLRTFRNQVRLARYIRREGIQVVHAYGFYSNVFAIPAAALSRTCVSIASVRDLGVFPDREKLRSVTLAAVCRWTDCVLANSEAVRGWLVKQGVRDDRIRVIPNGIVIPAERSDSDGFPIRSQLGIDPAAPVIAVVGRLTRTKGIEYFLDAAAGVLQRFPSARFMVVGDTFFDPSYRVELENRAAAFNLQNRVIFTGHRDDVPKLLRETTISVLPTLSESFSNSLLEAMALGIPIVATNVGGNPELITDGEHGILVPPRDTAALSRSIIRLLESPELGQRLGNAAREKVVRRYSLETILHQTEDLYIELLERRGLKQPHLEPIADAREIV